MVVLLVVRGGGSGMVVVVEAAVAAVAVWRSKGFEALGGVGLVRVRIRHFKKHELSNCSCPGHQHSELRIPLLCIA